jgi:hypothetical protein
MGAGPGASGGYWHDGVRPVLGQKPPEKLPIPDVSPHEDMVRIFLKRIQVADVPGIGEKVEVDDAGHPAQAHSQNEIRTDESGSPRNQPGLHSLTLLLSLCGFSLHLLR